PSVDDRASFSDPALEAYDPDRVAAGPDPQPIRTPTRTTPPPAPTAPQPQIEPIQTASDFQQTPVTEPAVSKTYTIRAGDDFATIARRTWGSEAKWVAIQRANPDVDPRRLRIGQKIVIPTLEADALRRSGELSSAAQSTALGRRAHVTVEKGDSLTRISRKVYGRSSLWETIYQANRDKLSSPDDLKVGMVLAIPPRPKSASASASRSSGDSEGIYTVRSGDTLSAIARKKLGSAKRWPMIYEANRDRLSSPEDIQVGQKLRIPSRPRLLDAGHQTK
ncbi:MAG: LysM peptidoglycan-binding domain-containing protein, partial [Phycisphaeraceae bacterium]|nr:LysM peptidoglycan-binding domain-containing protein [Phycisphaeraceae bacterium]